MKSLRILVMNAYDIGKAEQMHEQQKFPAQHFLGVMELKRDHSHNVMILPYEKYPLLNKIGNLFDIQFLDQQIRALGLFRKYDLIFAPFAAANTKLLILAKLLGIVRKPIVILVHNPLLRHSNSRIKRWISRKLILKYDKVIFLSERMQSDMISAYRIDDAHVTSHFACVNLGTDVNFYKRFIGPSENPPQHSVISSGNSFRDFDILVTAARKVNVPFKIYCKPASYPKSPSIPDHVELLSGEFPYEHISKDIAAASIVLIPLSRKAEGVAGLTSLLEALALGKPVIMTKNNYINIDLEKENIGLTVDEGDAEGWVQAISSLLSNPRRLKEMGDNSLRLASEKFNSTVFGQEIATAIDEAYRQTTNKSPSVGFELSGEKLLP